MNKEVTSRTLNRVEPEGINEFLDRITVQIEELMTDVSNKTKELAKKEKEIMVRDEKIHRLAIEVADLKQKLSHYESIEENLSKTVQFAKEASLKIQESAQQERERLLEEAKRNANRIVNEALINAEKTEMEANMLRKNIKLLKNRMKKMIDSQITSVGEK